MRQRNEIIQTIRETIAAIGPQAFFESYMDGLSTRELERFEKLANALCPRRATLDAIAAALIRLGETEEVAKQAAAQVFREHPDITDEGRLVRLAFSAAWALVRSNVEQPVRRETDRSTVWA